MKAVIYARYSYSGQRSESIEGQLRDCHAFAERKGFLVVGEYCDYAKSGTSADRPQFQKMVKDSAKKQFEAVICWKSDRFARSRYDAAIYKHRLRENGVTVIYSQEAIPDGPEGIIVESIMEGFAEYYSANLSENIKRGNYDSALKRQTLGRLVFGLREGPDKRYEIDPVTAPVVRRIFEAYADGISLKRLVAELDAAGIRTQRGKPFTCTALNHLLKNEKYIGMYRYLDIEDPNGIPPIIDKDLFDKVRDMMDWHARSPAAKRKSGGYLLSGKLYCGLCGRVMAGDSGTARNGTVHFYYTCAGRKKHLCTKERVRREPVESAVVQTLSEIVCNDDVIEAIADRFIDWQEHKPHEVLDGLRDQLKRTEKEIDNIIRAISSGLFSDALNARLTELEDMQKALRDDIAQEEIEEPHLTRESIIWFLLQFRQGSLDDEKWKMHLIDTFLKSVYLYDDQRMVLDVNFCGQKESVSLKNLEADVLEPGSDSQGLVDLPSQNPNLRIYFFSGHFFILSRLPCDI